MPTRMPGGIFVSTADWETLLAHLERLRIAVEEATATAGACDARVQRLEGRVRGLETMIGAPTWRIDQQAARLGVLAAIEALNGRVAQLEDAVTATDGLIEERLGPRLGRQVEEIHLAVHRPGERPRTVGGGLAAAVAALEQALHGQAEALGKQQGGAASVTGALERLGKQIAAAERRQEVLAVAVEGLATAQRAGGDQLAALLVQQQARLDGDDALTLLTRLLASPGEVAPLFRRDQFVCFAPARVQQWLLDKGLTRREGERVRSVWRDAGYVPSERKDSHNKRVKIAAAKSPPYFMVVPTLTYARLRLPVPPDLPTEPPRGAPTA